MGIEYDTKWNEHLEDEISKFEENDRWLLKLLKRKLSLLYAFCRYLNQGGPL